ncbi:MAG: aspartate-semialdehyde dehydrogenase [Candidatus Saelkia tenebricola]|nr:aspartate-semialdehyde dehydrogenase [Candidatus Saelkia tenebricola]
MKEYNVAVAGATGVVGREMINVLEESGFPVKKLLPLASERSLGKEVNFKGNKIKVELLGEDSFKDIDIALFSAGASISKKIAPFAVQSGGVVIDNSSAFRMDKEVPLVVPEVNPQDAFKHNGIIANPNCSTIQMVVVLKPIHDMFGIKRVIVSTYQSVSGWGKEAVDQLWSELDEIVKNRQPLLKERVEKVLPHQIAFNLFPHIDIFTDDGYTKEELKMANETNKIMHADLGVSATCVRVPVLISHSEAINIELNKSATPEQIKEVLSNASGVKVMDDVAENIYPMPLYAAGYNPSYVGRIRKDSTIDNGIWLWVVSDNLKKGAALNAVQIAELLIKEKQ